jgi:hypothetical protein
MGRNFVSLLLLLGIDIDILAAGFEYGYFAAIISGLFFCRCLEEEEAGIKEGIQKGWYWATHTHVRPNRPLPASS